MSENALTRAEFRRLEQYEATIQNGMNGWIEVSRALLAIREEQLYLADYSSFEDYCQGRWQFGRRYAYQLMASMAAAEDVAEVQTIAGTVVPKSEAVSREISKVEAETDRADLWAQVVKAARKDKKGQPTITASLVSKIRRTMFPTNHKAPDHAQQVRALMRKLDDVMDEISTLEPVWKPHSKNWQRALETLEAGRKSLESLAH